MTKNGVTYRGSMLGVLALCFLVALTPLATHAQQNATDSLSFDFRGDALQQVLEQVAEEAEIDMVYDPGLVEGITVYQRIESQSVPEALRNILAGSHLDFVTLSSGTIVIIEEVNKGIAYGSYAGKVVDQQSGEPLPGATVLLADASGGTSTSKGGTFAMNKLVSGTYKIIFSYVGYQQVSKTVTIKPKQKLRQKVKLKPKPIDFAPVVVNGDPPPLSYRSEDGQSVTASSKWQVPGKMRDPIQSLTLFSGVNYGLPMTDLHLQGGQTSGHRIRLDGVPVYNPYSFGQMYSAFSPYAINRIRLHKAGYGVDEGSQISGLIDMNHDISSVNKTGLMGQADPLSINLRGDLLLPMKSSGDDTDLKVMSAARFNYWDLFKDPTLNQTLGRWNDLDPLIANLLIDSDANASEYQPREQNSKVGFYDWHLASRYNISTYETLTASMYVGSNSVSTDLLNQSPSQSPEYLYARDAYQWDNVVGQLSYNYLLSARMDLNAQLSYSANSLSHRYIIGTSNNAQVELFSEDSRDVFTQFQDASSQNLVPNQRNENQIQHLTAQTDVSYSFSPGFRLEGGLKLDYVRTRLDFSDLFYLPTQAEQRSTFLGGYLNGHWSAGDYWRFTAGNRLTFANSTNDFYAEPRVSIRYDRPDTDIGYWSVRLAGGLYRQFINQYEVTNPGPSSVVPSFTFWSHAGTSDIPKAWHASSSFHWEPSTSTSLNVEWFYKWQPSTYIVSYDNLLQGFTVNRSSLPAFAEPTHMTTLGGGLRFKQSIVPATVKVMLGYDYSFARIDMQDQFGRSMPPPWNEPHRLQLRALWNVSPQLRAVAKWQSSWGRSWGFRQSYYNYFGFRGENEYGGYDFRTPEDDQMRPFHQLDLSLVYQPDIRGLDLELRADLNNILDRRNTIDWSLGPKSSSNNQKEITKRTMPGFNPSLSVKVKIK